MVSTHQSSRGAAIRACTYATGERRQPGFKVAIIKEKPRG